MVIKKILIVDDREENRIVLQNFFSFFGKREDILVFTAETSDEAYSIVLKEKPNLIFLDLQIETRTSGIEIARKIRENLPDQNITIWAITAQTIKDYNDTETLEEKCLKAGCNKYITKPFDQKKLIIEVSKLLNIPIPEIVKQKMDIK